ncbi:MAG: peptide chain release factor N(5)-glutamine methyltransferase [Patescibacteria group bacterium]|nr:peptide chain release factor N(5)-glutamine methyltransferase [Patescibacteria group bacterium]
MNIQQALKTSADKLKQKNIPSASLDAEVLLLEALNKNRDKTWLYIHNNYKLNKDEEKLFNNFISQREKHKPVAYIINRKEFYGYNFYVNENVLIPRPETELIVEKVLKIISGVHSLECKNTVSNSAYRLKPKLRSKKITLLDIGTGSGCIPISILNELVKNKKSGFIKNTFANDISKKAIEVAKINAKKYNLDQKIKFIIGDLEKAISKKIFLNSSQIIITANLPYIKNSDYETLQPNVRNYEPAIALKAGKDGLDYIKKLLDLISKTQLKLNQNIYLFLEADPEQMNKITAVLNEKFDNLNIRIIKDLNGKERIIVALL